MDRRRFFQHSLLGTLAGILPQQLSATPTEPPPPPPLPPPAPLAPEPATDGLLSPFEATTVNDDRLEFWRRQDRVPVWDTDDPDLVLVIEAIRSNRRIFFRYPDADHSESRRNLSPSLVFKVKEFHSLYVAGYCHLRGEERVFHFNRMSRIILVTKLVNTSKLTTSFPG